MHLRGRANVVGQARSEFQASAYREAFRLDLRDGPGIAKLLKRVRPDVVLNAAAISGHETAANDPEQARAVNVEAVDVLAETCHDLGARLIHISTDAVFSGLTGNYSEEDSPEPFSVYGETKLVGEEKVRSACDNHLIVRTNFFGWSYSGNKSVLEFFVNALRARKQIRGYPDFVVTSVYVRSLVDTIWQLSERQARGTVHVASSDALSKYDFGLRVASVFDLDPELIHRLGPGNDSRTVSRSRNLSLDCSLATSLVARPMQSQAEGIRQAYREESDARSAFHAL